MNKQRYWPLLFFAICLPATAVELGTLQARSFLNQALEARLLLRGVDERDLAGLRFSLADRATYRRYRLHPPFDPQSVDFKIVVSERGQPELHLRSRQPVTDPIVEILLKVMSRRDGLIRRYTLFLDPPGIASLAAATAEAEADGTRSNRPLRAESRTVDGITRSAPARSSPAPTTGLAPSTGNRREFVLEKGLSISMIAQNSKLHEKYSVYQIMRAVYLTNPEAFADGNINRLIYGSRLVVPPESLIAEVARRQAIEFVKTVSRDNPAFTPPLHPSRGVDPAASEKTATGMRQEIETPRPMAPETESPTLSGENEQQARETPAETIGILVERGERNRATADSANRRPETVTPASTSADSTANVDRGAAAEAQATDRSGEFAELDRKLQQKDRRILELTQQVEALQRDVAAAAAATLEAQADNRRQAPQPPTPAVANSQSPTITPRSSAPTSATIRNMLTWGLPALALVLAAVFGLYRWVRTRREPPTQTPLEQLLAEEMEAHTGQVDIDITEISLRPTPEPAAEPPPQQPQPVKTDDAHEDQTLTKSEELILEVDVRLAYELYPEALEMLEQARQEHGDALWIDAKTLETYAAMGKRPEFLELFEKKRDALQSASPIVWAEISALHADIERKSKLSSAG